MIQEEATTLFKLLCDGVDVDLDCPNSLQPDFIISKLPRTDDYYQYCKGDHATLRLSVSVDIALLSPSTGWPISSGTVC